MKFIKSTTLLFTSLTYVLSQLSGNQGISTHHYDAIASVLDTNPIFCGVLGKHMDISRITAVQGLSQNQCGTCLKLTSNGKTVYVMALDRGGQGLDLNKNSFLTLFGEDTGIFQCSWEPTDSSNCQGIVTGGDYQLPGMTFKPKVQTPIQIVSPPQPKEIKEEPKEEKKEIVKEEQKEEKKEEVKVQVKAKKAEQEPKEEVKKEKPEEEGWCTVTGASKCTDNNTRISVCAFGVVFPITCPVGTTCDEIEGVPRCVAIQN